MKTLYLDCFSGISGDMAVGALLDLDGSFDHLQKELAKLKLEDEYRLQMHRSERGHVTGTQFDVVLEDEEDHSHDHHSSKRSCCGGHGHEGCGCHDHGNENDGGGCHHHHHSNEESSGHTCCGGHGHDHSHQEPHLHGRMFSEIRHMIQDSSLSSFVKMHAISIFRRIAEVEGRIHGVPMDEVHFHEVGAVDSIVDVIGFCILLEKLAPEQIIASPPVEGHGYVRCAHGHFPVPTMATLELLKNVPLRQINIQSELITPTGAAILAEFVSYFGLLPPFSTQKIGYGLGSKNFPTHPNVVRAVWGETSPIHKNKEPQSQISILETQLDDLSGELTAIVMDRLLTEGALDVYFTPIQMKKGRPGQLITVLCEEIDTEKFSEILLRESGTFGLRVSKTERICLEREIREVEVQGYKVKIKIGKRHGKIVSWKPEFSSCKELALKLHLPVRDVWKKMIAAIPSLLE